MPVILNSSGNYGGSEGQVMAAGGGSPSGGAGSGGGQTLFTHNAVPKVAPTVAKAYSSPGGQGSFIDAISRPGVFSASGGGSSSQPTPFSQQAALYHQKQPL